MNGMRNKSKIREIKMVSAGAIGFQIHKGFCPESISKHVRYKLKASDKT